MGDIRRCNERYCCQFQVQAPAHHARLLEIERNPFDRLVELIEIAATWHELEYSEGESLVEPRLWPEFAEMHGWERPDRVMDLMLSLASLAREPYRIDPDCAVDPWARAMATVTAISATQVSDQNR